jgi:sugar/nucleoside kinase (ribokinase family)
MSERKKFDAIVAGHLCLDIIPALGRDATIVPGALLRVGPALLATGGAVSNTGIALHRLGVDVSLAGKVGDDILGRAIVDFLGTNGPHLADGVIVSKGEASSYSVVINPPGIDRTFLHCPGTNDTYGEADFARIALEGARLVHFGYPPLMKKIYDDGGAGLADFFASAREKGITTSLDMARPDPASEAGRVDWASFLRRVLPHVDVFLPSIDELLFFIDRPRFDELERQGGVQERIDGALLSDVATRLLDLGVAIAAIKLGEQGLYVRTSPDEKRIASMGGCSPTRAQDWTGRELLSPCMAADVAGTTGAGDCTIAGFLAGLLKGLTAEDAIISAVAVGGCSVERADATGGVPAWDEVQRRLSSSWKRRDVTIPLDGWKWNAGNTLAVGPANKG